MRISASLLCSCVLLLPAAAFAQPYAVAQLGYASADFPVDEPFNGVLDDNSIVYGVDVGFGFGKRYAAEIGIDAYGSFDGRATPCAAGTVCAPTVVSVSGNNQTVYKAALLRRFGVGKLRFYGKAGYYSAKIKTNIDLPDKTLHTRGLLLAGGVRWNFENHPLTIGVEASRFDDNVSQVTMTFGWRGHLPGE
jgi:hypothetical protein